jgi:hypothetical protein
MTESLELRAVGDTVAAAVQAAESEVSAEQVTSSADVAPSPPTTLEDFLQEGKREEEQRKREAEQRTLNRIEKDCEVYVQARRDEYSRNNPGAPIPPHFDASIRTQFIRSEAVKEGVRLELLLQPVQTAGEFLERPLPPKEPLVEGLLNRRDIVAFGGRRRHGKTTFVGNLALALTLPKTEFLGYRIPKPVRVLAIFLEDDAGELQTKIKRMCKGDQPNERLAIYTREDFIRSDVKIDVADKKFRKFIRELCEAHRPDLIVLDNLSHLMGGDYNNAKLSHEVNQLVFKLASDFNHAIIIPAHPRKRDRKALNSMGFASATRLRDDQEGFFEDIMGSSHFVNSCGSLWGIERDLATDRTDFLGGTQRSTGQQSLMTLEKDDDDWLRVISDYQTNFEHANNTEARKKAWGLLPEGTFSYSEAGKAVKQVMKSSSTFNAWFGHCKRLGVVVPEGDKYRKATPGTP